MSDLGTFDELDSPATLEEAEPGASRAALYNIITIVFLALSVLAGLAALGIIVNPNMPYNIFPPDQGGAADLPTPFVLPTLTPTLEIEELPPTWTPEVTPTSSEPTAEATTETQPEGTPPAEATGESPESEGTPAPANTPLPGQPTLSAFPFTLQEGTPAYTPNSEENGGCEWMGLAGQVFDLNNQPAFGIAVRVTGENYDSLIYTATHIEYGPSGYELELNTAPIEAEFEVQLFSSSGQPLSDKYVIRTKESCEENLIIVNFVQNHEF